MRRLRRYRWLGLYALLPLTVVLLALEHVAALSPREHAVVLMAIVLVIAVLANRWMMHHAGVVERDGVDADLTWLPPSYKVIRGDLEWDVPAAVRVETQDQAYYASTSTTASSISTMEKGSV